MDTQAQRPPLRYAAILVAAGQSQRMGGYPKACLTLQGVSALEYLAQCFRACSIEPLVVTGYHAELVEAEASRLHLPFSRNPAPEKGMLSSIQHGARALPPPFDAFFVHPVDCPLLRPITLRLLTQYFANKDSVSIPSFLGQSGHPPLLPAPLLSSLISLAPDTPHGLAHLLGQYPTQLVPVPDSAIVHDMDTPDDYAHLKGLCDAMTAALFPDEAMALMTIVGVSAKGIAHGQAVGAVAESFALSLQSPACPPWLCKAGGLVHDIGKGHPKHEAWGAQYLEEMGLSRLAVCVRDHRDLILPENAPITARELVYIADKYCQGNRWVPIETRFTQKMHLFADDPESIRHIQRHNALAFEARLKKTLGKDPSLLAKKALA